MKIVVASLPAYGHLYPMLPLARALVVAGHDVVVAAGEPFLGVLPFAVVHGVEPGLTLHAVEEETLRDHPGPDFVVHMFGTTTVRHVEPTLRALFDEVRPDLVVHEVLNVGAAVAAAGAGIRAVAFGIGLWSPLLAGIYTVAGVDPALPGGYLDPIPASVQNPGPLPGTRQPVRSVAWGDGSPLPGWLATSPRRRVYITLGTVAFGAVEVLGRAVRAAATHDVDVLVAVGPAGDPALLGELRPNVHLEKFVPQAEVLRHVDLVVHHGGTGTMLGTLAEGLPQLILPQGADQPFNAMAIERAGAGRSLDNDAQTPETLAAAVGDLLAPGPERREAKRIAEEMATMPSPETVATALTS